MKPTSAPGQPAAPPVAGSKRLGTAVRVVALAVFAVGTFPDLKPLQWGWGLEWSWQMALTKSVERGLVYGRDFCFTYGPLGFLSCPRDVGGLFADTVVWRLVLHAFFCTSVGLAIWSCRSLVLACLLPLLLLFSKVQDDTSTVVLLSELAFLVVGLQRRVFWPALPAAFLAAVGLLVKFNLGVAGVLTLAVWAGLCVVGPQRKQFARWLVPVAAVFAVTFLGGFRAYGGPLDAVPDFLRSSARIAGGYSAQMALPGEETVASARRLLFGTDGSLYDNLYYAGFGGALVALALAAGGVANRRYLALAALLAVPAFVVFKSAFVRFDVIHVTLFAETFPALVALVLVPAETRRQQAVAGAVGVAVLALAVYGRPWPTTVPEKVTAEAAAARKPGQAGMAVDMNKLYRVVYLPEGPGNLLTALDWESMRRKYREDTRRFLANGHVLMPPTWLERIGDSRIDAYPWEASLLFINKLNWDPRPVFQSYSAYLPDLDEANARHYRAPDGPRFVLFHANSIDNQHPWFVDPLTLLEVYRNYDIVERADPLLLLQRRAEPRAVELEPAGTATVRIGQSVTVPRPGDGLLFAALPLRLTAGGKVRETLWKVYPPSVQLKFADGTTHTSRLVWRNAASGIPISDLPMDRASADALWNPKKRRAVTAFTIQADPKDFEGDVELTWLKLVEKDHPAGQ